MNGKGMIGWEKIIGWVIGLVFLALVIGLLVGLDPLGKLKIVFGEGEEEDVVSDGQEGTEGTGGSGEGDGTNADDKEGTDEEGDSKVHFEVEVEGDLRGGLEGDKEKLLRDSGIEFRYDLCGEVETENCIDLEKVDDVAVIGLIELSEIYGDGILIYDVSEFSGAVYASTGNVINGDIMVQGNLNGGVFGEVGSIYVVGVRIFRLEERSDISTSWRIDFDGE
tara:strand:+ start:155 stop:820 length:666 start_codon:yes stop_codon:yes gene_type:complete